MKKEHFVSIDTQLCVGCGRCVNDCPSMVLTLNDKKAVVLRTDCTKCGHCVAICPKNAVSMSGFDDQPEPMIPHAKVDPDVLLHQLKSRRSMRFFTSAELSEEIVAKIIEAGQYTPTGSNKQSVSYVVLRASKDEYERIALKIFRRIKKFADFFSSQHRNVNIDDHFLFKQAPVVIVIKSTDQTDGALAASTMELMAQSLGLGALYSGFFVVLTQLSRKLKKMLLLKKAEKVVATLVLGYPAVKYVRTAQREAPDVTFR